MITVQIVLLSAVGQGAYITRRHSDLCCPAIIYSASSPLKCRLVYLLTQQVAAIQQKLQVLVADHLPL